MVKIKLTKEDLLSLPELYRSGLSSWILAKKFNTDHSNILKHLKKQGVHIRSRSCAAKQGVMAGRIKIKRNEIPKNLELNEDLAYILGVLAGDGYMDFNDKRRTHYIGLSATDKEFVEKFKNSLHDFFNIYPSNEFRRSKHLKWHDQYITRLCSKDACNFINFIGQFKKENWRVSDIIKNSEDSIKCSFIKGFFDSEGEIDKKIWRIGATSMNLVGLKELGQLLDSLEIRYTITKIKDNRQNTHQKYRLRIQDKYSIILFKKLIGFTIIRKQKVLYGAFPRDRLTP